MVEAINAPQYSTADKSDPMYIVRSYVAEQQGKDAVRQQDFKFVAKLYDDMCALQTKLDIAVKALRNVQGKSYNENTAFGVMIHSITEEALKRLGVTL